MDHSTDPCVPASGGGESGASLDVAGVVATAQAAARALVAAGSVSPHALSQVEFSDLVAGCQQVINMVTAAQDAAIARLVSFEGFPAETGEWVCASRGLGFVSGDGVDLVATATGMTRRYAGNRVDLATSWAIDHTVTLQDAHTAQNAAEQAVVGMLEPDPVLAGQEPPLVHVDDPEMGYPVPTRTGLGQVHQAMATGRIDDYRAWVIASELAGTPAQAAASILDRINPHLDTDTGPGLRRRIRRLQATLCPHVLQDRYVQAVAKTGLTRDAREPGLDTWTAHLPAGHALPAWAPIDALARQYRHQDTHPTLEIARAHALLDLINGNATITTTVIATLPAPPHNPSSPPAPPEGGNGQDTGTIIGAGPRAGFTRHPRKRTPKGKGKATAARPAVAEQEVAEQEVAEQEMSRPAAPGPASWGHAVSEQPVSSDTDLVEVTTTVTGPTPVLLPRDALPAATHTALCDPVTGALTDPDHTMTSSSYRPGVAMTMFVRARDGHCRFPGCTNPATHADLDHTTPWPAGPTTPRNLAALCRRHHRLKTLMRWRYHLDPNTAVATWTTPTGRTLTTTPIDHLHGITLPNPTPPTPAVSRPEDKDREQDQDPEFSPLEYHLEHTLTTATARVNARLRGGRQGKRDRNGRRQSSHRALTHPTKPTAVTYTPTQPIPVTLPARPGLGPPPF